MSCFSADELKEVDEFLDDAAMGLQCLQLLSDMGVRVHTNLVLRGIVTEGQDKLTGALLVNSGAVASGGGEPQRQQQVVSTSPTSRLCCCNLSRLHH